MTRCEARWEHQDAEQLGAGSRPKASSLIDAGLIVSAGGVDQNGNGLTCVVFPPGQGKWESRPSGTTQSDPILPSQIRARTPGCFMPS
jgi:hypothetical protein